MNGINSAKETDANNENLDEDIVEEDYCEPVSMQERQDRCMVSFSVTSAGPQWWSFTDVSQQGVNFSK